MTNLPLKHHTTGTLLAVAVEGVSSLSGKSRAVAASCSLQACVAAEASDSCSFQHVAEIDSQSAGALVLEVDLLLAELLEAPSNNIIVVNNTQHQYRDQLQANMSQPTATNTLWQSECLKSLSGIGRTASATLHMVAVCGPDLETATETAEMQQYNQQQQQLPFHLHEHVSSVLPGAVSQVAVVTLVTSSKTARQACPASAERLHSYDVWNAQTFTNNSKNINSDATIDGCNSQLQAGGGDSEQLQNDRVAASQATQDPQGFAGSHEAPAGTQQLLWVELLLSDTAGKAGHVDANTMKAPESQPSDPQSLTAVLWLWAGRGVLVSIVLSLHVLPLLQCHP